MAKEIYSIENEQWNKKSRNLRPYSNTRLFFLLSFYSLLITSAIGYLLQLRSCVSVCVHFVSLATYAWWRNKRKKNRNRHTHTLTNEMKETDLIVIGCNLHKYKCHCLSAFNCNHHYNDSIFFSLFSLTDDQQTARKSLLPRFEYFLNTIFSWEIEFSQKDIHCNNKFNNSSWTKIIPKNHLKNA